MAKDSADKQTPEFDYSGIYNDEDTVASLGELDLGNEVEPVEPEQEDEPVEESAEAEDDAQESEEGEQESTEDGDDGEQPAEDAEGADAEADDTPTDEQNQPDEAPPAKPKQPFIPKSRFDQRTAQLRAAERELEETRQKLRQVETDRQKAEREANTLSDEQIQAKMTEANAALLEGETDKAAKLQSEVFAALRQGSQTVEQETGQQVDPNKIAADVRDQMTFEQTLERLYTEYPALDENSDAFDEAVSQEAVELQAFYYQQGYTRAEATERAATAVVRLHGLQGAEQPAQTPPVNKKADMAKRAQAEAKRSKVDKARKAPPSTSSTVGASEDSVDHMNLESLSVEDWSALPDSVRSRLLGDTV